MYSACNMRDFGQLLSSLHLHLRRHTCEQEKANEKKLNSKSLLLFDKLCLQENLLPKHTHILYIYIYIYIFLPGKERTNSRDRRSARG